MSKNFLLKTFFTIAGFLVLPAFCFAVSYQRIPSDFLVYNPIQFQVSDVSINGNAWRIYYDPVIGDNVFSQCVEFPLTSYNFVETLPIGKYTFVILRKHSASDCSGGYLSSDALESAAGNPIFEVKSYSIIPTPFNAISSSTAYIGSLVNSIAGFLWLIIGLPLAFLVIQRILKLFPK